VPIVQRSLASQGYVIGRFPNDLAELERASWVVHGTVLAYGKDERALLQLSAHNDRDDGSWHLGPTVYFSPNQKVLFPAQLLLPIHQICFQTMGLIGSDETVPYTRGFQLKISLVKLRPGSPANQVFLVSFSSPPMCHRLT